MVPEHEVEAPQEGGFPKIRGYRLEGVLGKGATGVVYRARQTAVDRPVALKILHSELVGTKRAVRRLQREARTAARLAHPSIISAIDMGEIDGQWWYAMELVEGQSLSQRLREGGPLSEREALRLFIPICDALQHAHEGSVVHRDVKPANILIDTRGLARLVDLGLAFAEDDPLLTAAGGTLGTPHYISPEQARDPSSADTRSDIWSLGATMYHALAGHPPFEGDSVAEILSGVLYHRIPDPRQEAPQISKGLALVIRKCLTRDPVGRYQAPADLMRDLERIRERRNPVVRVGALDPVKDDPPAWRRPLSLALVALIIVAVGWVVVARPWHGTQTTANDTDVTDRVYAPLEHLLVQFRGKRILPKRALADLDRMPVPQQFDVEAGEARREVEEGLDMALRELRAGPEGELSGMLTAHRFIDADRALGSELFRALHKSTGYASFSEFPGGRPDQYSDWLLGLRGQLDSARQDAVSAAHARLDAYYENTLLAESNVLKEARRWRDALATLQPHPREWEAGADLRQLHDLDYSQLVSNQKLDRRLVRSDYLEVDGDLQTWANQTEQILRQLLERGVEVQVGDKLREEFRVELDRRGLSTDQFPTPAPVLQLVEQLAQTLESEEALLMKRDAERLFVDDDRIGVMLCSRRDYAAARAHWDRLIEDDWRSAVREPMLLRRRECDLLSALLLRAEQGVSAADGARRGLLWTSSIPVNGVLVAGADPLRRGFELRDGSRKWLFQLAPSAADTSPEVHIVQPDDLLELAGNAQVGSSADERLVRALFLYYEGRYHMARLALPLGSGDELVGDLTARIEIAINAERSVRSELRITLVTHLRTISRDLTNYGNRERMRPYIEKVLQDFKGELRDEEREMLESALESIDREARKPTMQEVYQPHEFKALVGLKVRMLWDFAESSAGGAWTSGKWERTSQGWWLRETVAGDREFLSSDSAPTLELADPLDSSQAMRVTLDLEHLELVDQGNELLITVAGFHVVFLHSLDDPGSPRFLIDSGDAEQVLARCRNGEGASYPGFKRGRRFRLDFDVKQIGGHMTLDLDGERLKQRQHSFLAPESTNRTIEVHSRRPMRLLAATVEGKRRSN